MGFVGMSGAGGNAMGANAMQHLNQFMLQNLQSLIAANPNFLTGGIPNKLLSQMWSEPAKAMSYVSVKHNSILKALKNIKSLPTTCSKCNRKRKTNMTTRKWVWLKHMQIIGRPSVSLWFRRRLSTDNDDNRFSETRKKASRSGG